MENTCFETLKLQNFSKILVFFKDVKQWPLYDVIFKALHNSFKVIYRDQTAIEMSTLSVVCIF